MHVSDRITAREECQYRLLVLLMWEETVREWDDEFVIVVSFVKNQAVPFVFDTLNILIISFLSEDIERHLRSLTSLVEDFLRLIGFANHPVCVPMSLLARGVAVESLDEADTSRVWGTVAAGTDSGGNVFAA